MTLSRGVRWARVNTAMANHAREDPDTNGLDILDTESNPPHNKFDRTSSRSVILMKVHHGPLPTVNVNEE